jgi:hypothetical protein
VTPLVEPLNQSIPVRRLRIDGKIGGPIVTSGRRRALTLDARETIPRRRTVLPSEFDTDVPSCGDCCRDQRAPGTGEWVEDHLSRAE